ncbi:MAG: glutathione S-transferase N-terminal domain-containing protein [Wenzhouxiangellaceae bacterium]|nr:glutathione S-transferase N-terminal domain-containing protein [Wenzhouxiangellaceae bacterium]
MKLFASTASPYARLVRAVVIEKGLDDDIAIQWVNPWDSPDALIRANPFSRVPALETADGTVVTEALAISYFLERLHPAPALIPSADSLAAMSKAGLAAGTTDAAVAVVIARRLDAEGADSHPLTRRRLEALARAMPTLAAAKGRTDVPDLGDLFLVVALDYVDFRLPDLDWKSGQPDLARWQAAMSERPSLARTAPHD